jgi:NAD(P)-dependent dehydrogenase (short-subunit alcohol dehydrogenase family)
VGAYNASKFALEALSDALRRELREHGVKVVVVEPGGIRTPIWDKGAQTADAIAESSPPEAERLYGGLIAAVRKEAMRISQEGGDPDAVAQAVEKALTSGKPKTRYVVGTDARSRIIASKLLPDKVFDALIARALRP